MKLPFDPATLDDATRTALRKQVVDPLWRRGELRYLQDQTQLLIRQAMDGCPGCQKFFLLCSRRLGKSFTLVVMAFELCLRKSNARVLYLAPWAKDAADIVQDIAATILEDCPKDIEPEYGKQEKVFTFKNGSTIRFKGVNGEHAQYLRGGACDMVILDECGLMDDLAHVVSDIVMPMVLTTNGRIYLATTPPRSPGHDSAVLYERCAGENASVKFTLLDNVRLTYEQKFAALKEAGEDPAHIPLVLAGRALPIGTTALREYFCEFVTDAAMAVLPEFTREVQKKIVVPTTKPDFFDAYVAMDPGMQDRTGILYGYWDFRRGKLVIEDESLLHGPSTLKIADEIGRKEGELWGEKRPLVRVSDIDLRLIADLWERHQISFAKAEKQDSEYAINLVRNMIQTGELEINPRCKHLVRQMQNAIWNNKVTDFARAGDQSPDGHYDLVAALKYLCRAVNRRKNPYPAGWGTNRDPNEFRSPRHARKNSGQGLLDSTPLGKKLAKMRRTH